MEAVCFKCGHEKSNPLKMCGHCQALPQSRKERIKSMCLSRTCLKTQNLIKASTYIKRKNRPPGFHEKVKVKAAELVDSMPEIGDSTSQSYDFSDSFFDFQELEHGIAGEKITVHAIGKPINDSIDSFNGNNNHNTRTKTYHTLEWEIGKDINLALAVGVNVHFRLIDVFSDFPFQCVIGFCARLVVVVAVERVDRIIGWFSNRVHGDFVAHTLKLEVLKVEE